MDGWIAHRLSNTTLFTPAVQSSWLLFSSMQNTHTQLSGQRASKRFKDLSFSTLHFTCMLERNQETNPYLRMLCFSELLTCQRVRSHCSDEPRVKTIDSASFLYYVSLTLPKHNAIAFCLSRLAFLCLSVSRCADERKIKPGFIFPMFPV